MSKKSQDSGSKRSKILDNVISSESNWTVNLTPEETGQKHTKPCIKCGTPLVEKVNWWNAFIKKKFYCCTECYKVDREQRRLAQKAKALGVKVLASYNKSKSGYVYLIRNPAWGNWLKVGMAMDAEDRLNSFQTSSPFRDYELVHKVFCRDRRKAEAFLHEKMEAFTKRGEWFEMTINEAMAVFALLRQRNLSV